MIIQFPYLLVAVVTVANAVELLINLVKNQIKMRHSLDSFWRRFRKSNGRYI